jgi:CubicO group peptidase (beta-lactamase class C family)
MDRREFVTASVATAALTGPIQAAAGVRTDGEASSVASALDRHLDRLAREDDLSGVFLLVRNGEVLLEKATGHASKAFNAPNSPDTRFNLGSIPKLFTSLAVMRYVQEGRLALDMTLAQALPEYPNSETARKIRLSQLLDHTSGLPNDLESHYGGLRTPRTVAEDMAVFVDKPLDFEPGSEFNYSNSGYVVLGRIMETLSGEDYFDQMRRTIFKPLGMTDTDFLRLDCVEPRMAVGHYRSTDTPGVWRNNYFDCAPRGSPAGGAYSTVRDLDRFARAFSAGELLAPKLTAIWTKGRRDYPKGRYALGVSEEFVNGKRILGHAGGHYGAAADLMIFDGLGYTFVYLSNSDVDAYWETNVFIKTLLAGSSPESRRYAFTRDVIRRAELDGADDAYAFVDLKRQKPREGVIDAAGYKRFNRNQGKEAMALFDLNARLFPKSLAALWARAEGLRAFGDKRDAIAAYRAFLALQPDDADATSRLRLLGAT